MLGRLDREEVGCDFPDCLKEYDRRPGKKVAKLQGEEVIAFCEEHAQRLTQEGVVLRSVDSIHEELKEAKDAPRRQAEQDHLAREKAFIEKLKQ